MKQKNIKKGLFTMLVVLEVFIFSGVPNFAQAFFSIESSVDSTMINSFLESSGLNVEESLNPMLQMMNIQDSKDQSPETSIIFSNKAPKAGEIIEAKAFVKGLENPDEAYFHWYIKREGEDELNTENMDIMEFRKWLATKLIIEANSDYDPRVFDQIFNGGNGDGIVQEYEYPEDTSDDGFVMYNGGQNNKGASDDQYIYVYSKDCDDGKGCYFELGEAEGDLEMGQCDDGYTPMCLLEDNRRDCPIYDPPVEGESSSSADGGSGGSSESDDDGSTGDGGDGGSAESSTKIEEESTATALRFSRCVGTGTPRCTSEGAICSNGGTPYCVIKPESPTGQWFRDLNDTCPDPKAVWDNWVAGYVAGAACVDFEGSFGFLKEYECGEEPSEEEDYDPFNGPTMHLGPVESYNAAGEPQPYGMPDAEFNLEAEIKWGLDPRESNTTGLSTSDEGLVVGYKLDTFSWEYQPGDEIGVVVEGTAPVPTKHHDNTFQTVFAFMSEGCKVRRKGAYTLEVKGKELLIRTAKMDPPMLNNCLKNNLVKPGANEYEGLSVLMTYGDDANQAITSGDDQTLSFNARASLGESGGVIDTSQLHYNWNITCGDNRAIVCDEGDDITQKMREGDNSSKTLGDNLHALNLLGNFPESCFDDGGRGYACVTTQVNTNFEEGTSAYGRGEVIIPLQKSGGKLKAFSTDSNGDSVSTREEICGGDGMDASLCRVVRGEIIGVEMPMPEEGTGDLISWTINGSPYFCNSSVSSECGDESNTNKIFFPIVNSLGDIITVNAIYNNPTEGEFANKTVSRSFIIVEPGVHIEPTSGGNFKTLGKYVDADGDESVEKSWRIIEISPGNSVALKASFTPSFIEKDSEVEWSFNGEKSFENTLQVVPDLPSNVSLKAVYRPSNVQALVNLFNVDQFTISDSYLRTSTRLVEGSEEELSSKDKAVGFFATTASNAPAYFFFMLKMVLIIGTLLFVSHLALSMTSYNSRRF